MSENSVTETSVQSEGSDASLKLVSSEKFKQAAASSNNGQMHKATFSRGKDTWKELFTVASKGKPRHRSFI